MANIIIGGVVFILIVMAIKNIMKNKGTCNCASKGCHCCREHYHNKK